MIVGQRHIHHGSDDDLTVDDSRFEIVEGDLKLKSGQALDYEAAASVTVTVTATDQGGSGLGYSESFTIAVNDIPDTTPLTP